jgi:hypothetical protein
MTTRFLGYRCLQTALTALIAPQVPATARVPQARVTSKKAVPTLRKSIPAGSQSRQVSFTQYLQTAPGHALNIRGGQ